MALKKILIFCILYFLLFGCKNDFKLNSSWEDNTIVYGVFDINDSIHYLRIQKAFLGEGNMLKMAKIEDSSSYFNNLEVKIKEIKNGNVVKTIYFDTVHCYNKKDGIFYNDKQILYMCKCKLNNSLYNLYIKNLNTSKIVTSQVYILDDLQINEYSLPESNFNCDLTYKKDTVLNIYENLTASIGFHKVHNSYKYYLKLRFYYDELNTVTNIKQSKYVDLDIGTLINSENNSNDNLYFILTKEIFWKNLKQNIKEDVLLKRYDINIEYIFSVSNYDYELYTNYQSFNKKGLSSYTEPYTNINNGRGLLTSRIIKTKKYKLMPKSRKELIEGTYTKNLGFVN